MRSLLTCFTCGLLIFLGFESDLFASLKVRRAQKVVTVKISHIPKSLEPHKVMYMEHFLLLQCFAQTLVRVNERGRIIGDLAESWDFSNGGKTPIFRLSKNAKFSNGEPVTAQDVIHSILKHFDGKNSSAVSGYLRKVVKNASNKKNVYVPDIKAVDKNTVQFNLKGEYPPFPHLLAMPGFSITKQVNGITIGSGPMAYTKSEDSIVLKSRKDFKGIAPKIESIYVSSASESDRINMANLINKKQIDFAIGFTSPMMKDVKFEDHVRLLKSNSLAINHVYFNTKRKNVLKNIRVRKRIATVFQKLAQRPETKSRLQEFSPTFIPRGVLPDSYYERKSLDESFILPNKTKIDFVYKGHVYRKELIELVQQELKKSNIILNPIDLQPKEFAQAMIEESYDIIGGRYIGNFSDPDGFISVIDQSMKLKYGAFDNKELFESLEKVRFKSDKAERLASYAKYLKAFEEEYKIVPLYRVNIPILHHKDLRIPESSFRYESELWRVFWLPM